MNWNTPLATESQPSPQDEAGHPAQPPPAATPPGPSARPRQAITVAKTRVTTQENGKEAEIEVFRMSLGGESIELLPLKNWSQLDTHKWTVRGILPGSPAGLDIALDHVKMLGQTVSTADPEGGSKLEALFNEWLALEKENLEMARKKSQPQPQAPTQAAAGQAATQAAHFRVERDSNGQVHIRRFQGKEAVAEIGLNLPGFNGLFNQGLMRKPRKMHVGVLHDWVELDGEAFSFAKGNDDSARLEKVLNQKYLPDAALGRGKDVVVFANAASSTGFDIQFPVTQAGTLGTRKRPLVEESLALLQDPVACGVLHKEVVIKLTRPNLVFKLKTPDGGERYFERSPEHTVILTSEDGEQKTIDLSQPVNYMRLSPIELTAVFNHPALNRHSQAAPPVAEESKPAAASQPMPETGGAPVPPEAHATFPPPETPPQPPPAPPSAPAPATPPVPNPKPAAEPVRAETGPPPPPPPPPPPREVGKPPAEGVAPAVAAPAPAQPLPNSWLEPVLAQPPIRHDWFACTMYARIAQTFGNSHEGTFGLSNCWAVALDEIEDIADPGFKGIYLTGKHGFGYLCQGQMARFNHGVAFVGTQESALQGIGVSLVAVGLDASQRFVFVITDGYRKQFGVPEQTLAQEFTRLEKHGALIMSASELLHSQNPIEVLWTIPAAQADPNDPQTIESTRPQEEDPNDAEVVEAEAGLPGELPVENRSLEAGA